jgi:hypothetical protein
MTRRKSFIIHIDSLEILDDLTNEQAGLLFKAIRSHQLDVETDLDPLTKIAFSPFKNQFIRDDEKYLLTCKARADAGSKGGKAKAIKTKQKVANVIKSKQIVANLADSVSKNVSKNEIDSDNKKNMTPNKFSDEDIQLSKDIYKSLLTINPKHREPAYESWASDIRLMRERDGRTIQEISDLFKWVNNHQFWKSNILSPSKLRQQWDKLIIQRGTTKGDKHENFDNRDYKASESEFGNSDSSDW